ncbi:hypothetical protein [Mameliella sp.]|uniref:hypothetical protein n=1 Tax=Mameliella sp. TaxID=1924940 RepID=UPI003BAC2B40
MPNMANSQVTDTVSQTALMTLGTAGSVAQALMAQGFVPPWPAALRPPPRSRRQRKSLPTRLWPLR